MLSLQLSWMIQLIIIPKEKEEMRFLIQHLAILGLLLSEYVITASFLIFLSVVYF